MGRRHLWAAIAAALVLLAAGLPARAEEPGAGKFRSRIDSWLAGLASSTHGALRWVGSDPVAIRRDGDALVADIDHGRIAAGSGEWTLGRIEVRQSGPQPGEKTVAIAIALPKAAAFKQPVGAAGRLTLDGGKADFVFDAELRHLQDEKVGFDRARIEQPDTGIAVAAGPLAVHWTLAAAADGSWRTPVDFELKGLNFQAPQLGEGGIDRIAYHGAAAGPKLDSYEKLRDATMRLQTGDAEARQAGLSAVIALLPALPGTFSTVAGDAEIEGVKVADAKGGVLGSLAELEAKTDVSGLDGAAAAVRITLHYQGLKLAPTLVPPQDQPHQLVVDLGLADIDTATLRELLTAAAGMAPDGGPPKPDPMAMARLMGAAANLTPSLHAYDVAVDTDDVGLDLTGTAKGSPLSPQGWDAKADLAVRGLDAVPQLGLPALADMLPLLRQLGSADPATGKVVFHLASTPQHRLAVNGNDVSAWFADDPQLLKPDWPPLTGEDVMRVQKALDRTPSGVYDGATAAAVARFQKQNGLDMNGVVDAATRAKLGLPPPQR
jgi:hypothetical protein